MLGSLHTDVNAGIPKVLKMVWQTGKAELSLAIFLQMAQSIQARFQLSYQKEEGNASAGLCTQASGKCDTAFSGGRDSFIS